MSDTRCRDKIMFELERIIHQLDDEPGRTDYHPDAIHLESVRALIYALERELNEAKSDVAGLVRENNQRVDDFYESYARCEIELNEAKAEIERLRTTTGCTRGQREGSTQFCAEAVQAMKERDAAREALSDMLSQTVRIGGDVWELPSCSTNEVKRWRKSAGLEQLCT